jgi:hypothetical protein
MTTAQPGWYADPQNPSQVRFWNGNQWTDQTRPAQPAMDQYAMSSPPQFGTPVTAPPPFAPATYGYPVAPAGRPATPAAGASLWQRNRVSAIAAVFCVAYLAIAFATHFVILGIAPVLLTIRAFRRHEPFAAGALVLTIITLGVSLTALTH